MDLRHMVESYKFWDVVTLWAKERLDHEDIVARALAVGIIKDGLKCQSIDMLWVKDGKVDIIFRGYPYVGYCAEPEGSMVILRAEALEHLLAIVRKAKTPSKKLLKDEFIFKNDFRNWIEKTEQPFPNFWFSESKEEVKV
jgi:hypothetical protein